MKTQFAETLILRLTATTTSSVIADIQKILSIKGCLVLKDSFFRSNLKYIIERTDPKKEDIIERIAKLLKTKYLNKSGIMCCLTIKDVEQVIQKLKGLGVEVDSYDA
jgi:bloom syndrome protein